MRQSAVKTRIAQAEPNRAEPEVFDLTFDPATRQVLAFDRAGHRLTVVEEWRQAGGRFSGYCDGVLSLVADRADVTARALMRKHVIRQPETRLIALQGPRDRRGYSGRIL